MSQDREILDAAPWDAPLWDAAQDADNRIPPGYEPPLPFPGLASRAEPTPLRPRLHAMCALYAHSRRLDQKLSLVESLEALTLQLAEGLAIELLERGWRPLPRAAA